MAEIQDNFVLLCNELDVDSILPFLRQKKLLTTEEYERLLFSGLSPKEKRERLLLSVLPRKGRTHLEAFCSCLVLSGQRELARKLDKNIDITRKKNTCAFCIVYNIKYTSIVCMMLVYKHVDFFTSENLTAGLNSIFSSWYSKHSSLLAHVAATVL